MSELEYLASINAQLTFLTVLCILRLAWWLFEKFSSFLNSFF